MTVTLCVMLWPRPGREAGLIAYEDQVLALLPDHGGRLVQRARSSGEAGLPLEVQLIQFPSEAALGTFMDDERRVAMSDDRDRAIERTEVAHVQLIGDAPPPA
jgi:uncharacterized protein (DUF1330 family)